jgi:CYTH domain-containing protein
VPIENERKIVLNIKSPEKAFAKIADAVEEIEQSYIMVGKKQSARIRCSGTENLTFTFKQDVGKKTVEIETPISKDDYNYLKKGAISKLKKLRYRIGDWEVDFFKSNNKTYFVQAEIELPEHKRKPKEIHPLIKENLIYVVKRGDGRFSSKKLCNVKYACRLLQTLEKA